MAIWTQLQAVGIVARSLLAVERPDRLPRALAAMAPWGQSPAGLIAGGAARYPGRTAIHDDDGATSYEELWRRTMSIATGLESQGIGEGRSVGLLMRNRRDVPAVIGAVAALGADLVLLNTGFAGPQLADVVAAEGIDAIVHDDEFADVVTASGAQLTVDEAALDRLAEGGGRVRPPDCEGRIIILTSGTTGRPKGAARSSDAAGIEALAAVVERIPFRFADTQVVAAPMFHAWGLSHLLLGLARCATSVTSRRFDAQATLAQMAHHDARVLVVVPVMLSRMMEIPDEVVEAHPTPDLSIIASSGSAIAGSLVTGVLDRFGQVLYNLYGSTEVAVATIAGPDDLRQAPTTAGQVAFGVRVEILDDAGDPVAPGDVGRIFVGGSMRFDGYTGGGDKERIRGLLSSGDMGRFDGELLFVEGRDDDMIVSGGENVFPSEVEELLTAHPDIGEAAVIGVDDEEFGQALAAFVVPAGTDLTADSVREHVRSQLARHKVPRTVTFLDELPRNATGKLLRRELQPR